MAPRQRGLALAFFDADLSTAISPVSPQGTVELFYYTSNILVRVGDHKYIALYSVDRWPPQRSLPPFLSQQHVLGVILGLDLGFLDFFFSAAYFLPGQHLFIGILVREPVKYCSQHVDAFHAVIFENNMRILQDFSIWKECVVDSCSLAFFVSVHSVSYCYKNYLS
ncbi:uncharacterized protein ZBAI_07499 [Zygosaccharomyces bailii ISA1307]|nr:uncharacterized protein ZBAI_07499 [Zygosaccharomyces bailii ISA1307]